ncbi:MAG: hypothetical protein ACE5JL_12185, partial [Dehalococcoidia bacterium]
RRSTRRGRLRAGSERGTNDGKGLTKTGGRRASPSAQDKGSSRDLGMGMETMMDMRAFRELVTDEPRSVETAAPNPPHPGRDLRPEFIRYRDDGCEVSPSCLRCPLPRCRYDDPGWLRREAKARRDREVLTAHRSEGLGPSELARRFGLSRRTIHRILRMQKRAPENAQGKR